MSNDEDWVVISRGAEATLYKGEFLGLCAIKKVRHPKKYRDPQLDLKLRVQRTKREAKLLVMSKNAMVPVPFVYDVDLKECAIIMEYIDGVLLRDYIKELENRDDVQSSIELIKRAGEILAMLHEYGIIHGDYTTSNIIVARNGGLYVIDFGLGYIYTSSDPEDYAMELRVFSRGLEVFHYEKYGTYMQGFLQGYRRFSKYEAVIDRLKEIFRRGRYVSERRIRRIFRPRRI